MLSSATLLLALVSAVAATQPNCKPSCTRYRDHYGHIQTSCTTACAVSTPTPTPKPDPIDDCRTRTICIDKINSCGMMYGGCVPDCHPWPSFTPPPCPQTTLKSSYKAEPTHQ
ncbi:hypothetical protein CDD80_6620 [Ophiocordyceps camponoti-rufipedis]|uniref:Uncharacterized protein n=1 Tax=Ophiocordyceps camponoti-rufipedis TaxID=2004952 RepID=A0A2C5XEL0_9HYPO|nr:hypothetical protein CDD80_6620 [Ophiocordyceps camponoti-rufipedis]